MRALDKHNHNIFQKEIALIILNIIKIPFSFIGKVQCIFKHLNMLLLELIHETQLLSKKALFLGELSELIKLLFLLYYSFLSLISARITMGIIIVRSILNENLNFCYLLNDSNKF